MISLRRFAAAVVLTLGFAAPASAVTASPDFSDLWFNAAESGWGITFTQQANTIFAAMYVYGTDGTPRWYVATQMLSQPAASGQFKYGGVLYATTGTYFGTIPFNPASTVATPVGNMAITFSSSSAGTLIYDVGGVTITKPIVRQTFGTNSLAGGYFGGVAAVQNGCTTSTSNGAAAYFLSSGVTVTHTNNVVAIRLDGVSGSTAVCNFSGTYTQTGRFGTITAGIWSCTSSTTIISSGTFSMTDVDVQTNGITATFTGADNFCSSYVGRFGGLRLIGG
ncbi:hypothetical protein BWI17_10395 [Betaproteobacteria bacterium GR16-43]|nr:hypothetical protein BWI17_10395 [Betaproteobacteria bacterium GR16-43]